MQPTIISLFLLLLVAGATTSCDKDEPDGKSIFVDPAEEKTEFDFWLDRHYTEPYNIRFEYRMPDRETHFKLLGLAAARGQIDRGGQTDQILDA